MAKTQFDYPEGARAALVRKNADGSVSVAPVAHDESILNLYRDLISHLSAQPWPDEWLAEIHSYLGARLEARKVAQACGGFAIAMDRTWRVSTLPLEPMDRVE
ncbi:hypothetical protein [Bordetella genomosp. 7]|uniref:Uncharacterized protein n=1 Tax=Bordetella genomosp. 7 TaxID=1416805 RepID=A0A261RTD6_9BORD|nr:hypothetical protein [Bordetella genomosp. 7]OZI27533.1 hypothetical protein CAL19_02055 [Bordetella genomosp. 7]